MGRQLPTGRWINPSKVKGIPDITGIAKDGKALFVEVKFGRDKMSLFQLAFKKEVVSRGGYFIEAHCIEDIINWHHETFEKPVSKQGQFVDVYGAGPG